MEILRYTQKNFQGRIRTLCRRAQPKPDVESTVREIIAGVRREGDRALIHYTEKFGGPRLSAAGLLEKAHSTVAASTARAIAAARSNVRKFARQSLRKSWRMKNAQGGWVGERFDALERVGIYVPGGTAPLVSTAVMTVTLAEAAGVPEIVVCTPADASGAIHPALLYALRKCGATEIYRVGGAQAVAAMAVGTKTIRPVQKIAGPGNAFVVEAKRQLFGEVSIDLLPGPSEVLVIADRTANPAWAAADLLAQAEHGKGSGIVFITDCEHQLEAVLEQIRIQCERLSRREHLLGVIEKDAYFILVETLRDAVLICNAYAPEHAALLTANPGKLAADITTTGALFLGGYSPVAAGDFVAGPSHTLPTGGGGKSFPGLMADMFQRRTSWVELNRDSLRRSVPIISAFSSLEGLDAHGRSATIRLNPGAAAGPGKKNAPGKGAPSTRRPTGSKLR